MARVDYSDPAKHNERTRELLREMAKIHPEDPRAEMWAKV